MYNTTANLYDSAAAWKAPQKACDDIHAIFAEGSLHPPGLIGDLGSGTGMMSVLLAKKGWQVYGVELSEAMLAESQKKRAALSLPLQARLSFQQGDITTFAMPEGVSLDGTVCLSNTINHLVEWPQVEAFVRCAHRALKPGGILVLDSDTKETFIRFFNHPPLVVWDDGNRQMTRSCRFNQETGRANHLARIVQKIPGQKQTKIISEESMSLQYHPEDKLFEAFVAGGFKPEKIEPYNASPDFYTGFDPKTLWVLRKPV